MAPFVFTAPSGTQYTLQHPDLVTLLLDGAIPDPLGGVVEKLINQSMIGLGLATPEERAAAGDGAFTGDETRALLFLRWIVRQASVEPVISADLDEVKRLHAAGTPVKHLSQLPPADVYAIYFAAQGVAADLASLFREPANGQGDAVAAVHNGAGDAPAGVEPAGGATDAAVGSLHGGSGGDALRDVGGPSGAGLGRESKAAEVPAAPPARRSRRRSDGA